MTFRRAILTLCLVAFAAVGCSEVQVQKPIVAASREVQQAAIQYLRNRKDAEDPVENSVEFLLDQEYRGGRIVVLSYLVGPGNRVKWEGKRVVALLRLDQAGKMIGGGAIGTVALADSAPIPVAWTWLGQPEHAEYAFYGPITIPHVDKIELTEQDGTVSVVSVAGQGAFYIPRPFANKPGTGWGAQVPAKIRAIDERGRVVYEKEWRNQQ